MNLEKRKILIDRMGELYAYNGGVAPKVLPLIMPEQYFDGAQGNAGLLCNSAEELDNDAVLAGLHEISDRQDVYSVHVAVSNCDDDDWPFSDKIIIVTTATDPELLGWLPAGFHPDEMYERRELVLPAETVIVPEGYREVWLWFD